MIVLGIAPGVRQLAYCVLHYSDPGELPRVPDFGADLLKGIRTHGTKTLFDLQKKARIHVKILDVILERFPPLIIAVGPAAISTEPELHVEAARLVLRLAVAGMREQGFRIELAEWRTKAEVTDALDADKWSTILDGRIENTAWTPIDKAARKRAERLTQRLRKPAVCIAAASALAAGRRLRPETYK